MKFFQRASFLSLIFFFIATITSSCFTGVEGTKKISLSRDDKKLLQPSAEDEFFRPISGSPLADWAPGKRFIAADNKTALIFIQEGLPVNPDDAGLKHKILSFKNIEQSAGLDGKNYAVIVFEADDILYRYNTGKEFEKALTQITSDQLPLLIDADMVESAKRLLEGKDFWIKSALWYDSAANRLPGRKFVKVTVSSVAPGNHMFPLIVNFFDDTSLHAMTYLNFGKSGNESRSFANTFSLSDVRNSYSNISDEVWDLICRGKVKTGMTKDECRLSLGNPSEVDAGHSYSQTLDLWQYPDGALLWFEDGVLTRFRL